MLEIQRIIREVGSIEDANFLLTNKFGLVIRKGVITHPIDEDNIITRTIVYLYNTPRRKETKLNDITKEANGLILDKDGDVVSMNFQHIIRINENQLRNIDLEGARVELIEDGVMIVVYSNNDEWFVHTKYTIDGNEYAPPPLNQSYTSIATSLLSVKFNTGDWTKPFRSTRREYCFIFEFVSPRFRHVIKHRNTDLILLSIYDKFSKKELNRTMVKDCAKLMGFKTTIEIKNIDTPEKVSRLLYSLSEANKGLMIITKDGKRYKLYSRKYELLSKLVDTKRPPNEEDMAAIVLEDITEDAMWLSPKCVSVLELFEETIDMGIVKIKEILNSHKHNKIVIDSDLARIAVDYNSGALKKIEDGIRNISPESLIELTNRFFGDRLSFEMKILQ